MLRFLFRRATSIISEIIASWGGLYIEKKKEIEEKNDNNTELYDNYICI